MEPGLNTHTWLQSPCVSPLLCSRLCNATPVNQSAGGASSAYRPDSIKLAKWTGFFCGTLADSCWTGFAFQIYHITNLLKTFLIKSKLGGKKSKLGLFIHESIPQTMELKYRNLSCCLGSRKWLSELSTHRFNILGQPASDPLPWLTGFFACNHLGYIKVEISSLTS